MAETRVVAFRLHTASATLLEFLAKEDGVHIADVIRKAIAASFNRESETNPSFAAHLQVEAQEQLDKNVAEIGAVFGHNVLEHLEIRIPQANSSQPPTN